MFFLGGFIFFTPFRDIKHIILPYEKESLTAFNFFFKITAWDKTFELIVCAILVCVQAQMINRLNQEYYILKVNSYLPGIIFILITGSLMPLHRVQPVLISNILLLMSIDQILQCHKKEKVIENLFNSGFYLFIACLFYRGMVFYLFVPYAGLVLFRSFNLREWLMPVSGFLLPGILLAGILLLLNNSGSFYDNYFMNFQFSFIDFSEVKISIPSIIFYSYIFILIVFARITYRNNKIDSRRYFVFLNFIFLLSVIVFLTFTTSFIESIFIISIPLSFVLSYLIINLKREFVANIVVLFLLGIAVWIRFFG